MTIKDTRLNLLSHLHTRKLHQPPMKDQVTEANSPQADGASTSGEALRKGFLLIHPRLKAA